MIPRDDWNPSRPDRGVDVAAGSVLTRAGEPGDEFFGEMSLLDGGATVGDRGGRHIGPTAREISRRHFSALLRDVPGLTQTILVTLSKRVRQAEERAERLKSVSTGL
jgi:CRP-like cAMP-binding protein